MPHLLQKKRHLDLIRLAKNTNAEERSKRKCAGIQIIIQFNTIRRPAERYFKCAMAGVLMLEAAGQVALQNSILNSPPFFFLLSFLLLSLPSLFRLESDSFDAPKLRSSCLKVSRQGPKPSLPPPLLCGSISSQPLNVQGWLKLLCAFLAIPYHVRGSGTFSTELHPLGRAGLAVLKRP